MNLTLDQKYKLIKENIINIEDKDPITIINKMMKEDYINIHGPEHHFLDGASFLVAYRNNGGDIDINVALDLLSERSIKMPGAMCGYWGVCGSVSSLGACLSIINNTGPLTSNDYYKDNMMFTSEVINVMSIIGGPRCCKRNAFLSLSLATKFINEQYGMEIQSSNPECTYSQLNKQCIKNRCPFYKK